MMENPQKIITLKKSLAYITHGNELLVFSQPEFPEAGIQVPKGTVDVGETPLQTVEREIIEETGLNTTIFQSFLGETYRDLSDYQKPIIEHRHFFHFILDGVKKDNWTHYELFDADSKAPILFSFFWLPIATAHTSLIADHGQLLHLLELNS